MTDQIRAKMAVQTVYKMYTFKIFMLLFACDNVQYPKNRQREREGGESERDKGRERDREQKGRKLNISGRMAKVHVMQNNETP